MKSAKFIPVILFASLIFIIAFSFFKTKAPNIDVPFEVQSQELHDILSGSTFFLPSESKDNFKIVCFFSSWCKSCSNEIKSIINFKANSNLEIIGLAMDDKKEKVLSFLAKNGNPYSKVAILSPENIKIWNVRTMPTIFIIQGKEVILVSHSIEEAASYIERL